MNCAGFSVLVHFSMVIFSADPKPGAVVKVNGAVISTADVEFAVAQQGILEDDREQAEPKLIEQLIDRQLIRAFLAAQKIEPIADELQFQIVQAEDLIRKRGEDPQKLLAKIGYTPDRLKSELGLPLAWQVHVRKVISPQQIKEYFLKHKRELDGTQLRGRQIFLKTSKSPDEDEITAKKNKLEEVRRDILAKKLSFADAAQKYSEAPSREQGGDIGLFGWKGKLPPPVSKAAFALDNDEISEPIASAFGVHLIQVTERHPGDFSLEDVRTVIADRLSQQLWNDTIAKQRETAIIERVSKP